MKNKRKFITERPTRYVLKYGKSITEIAKLFGVANATVSEWNSDVEKSKWLRNRLNEMEVK